MERVRRISRAQAIAVPRPRADTTHEWVIAAIALALLLAGLLGS
jgi:hypothetical protein